MDSTPGSLRPASPRHTWILLAAAAAALGTASVAAAQQLDAGGFALGTTQPASQQVAGVGGGSRHLPFLSAPSLSDFASKRHLAYALAGGTATWLAFEYEDADAVARMVHQAPGDLGGDFGNVYGRATVLAGGTAALWTAGLVAGNENMTGAARDLATGLIIDGALVYALKTGVDRTRPNGERWSFPSGHTSSAFTVAPILWSRFGWRAGAPAYALAVATGLGRIEDHWHFPSDVIAGATLGLIVGEAVAAHHAHTTQAPGFIPGYVYMGKKGLGLQFRW